MQTIGKYDPPRNRQSYPYHVNAPYLRGRGNWDALNRAEYYIWLALRTPMSTVVSRAEREACKAKARFYLSLAARLRS